MKKTGGGENTKHIKERKTRAAGLKRSRRFEMSRVIFFLCFLSVRRLSESQTTTPARKASARLLAAINWPPSERNSNRTV